MLKKLSHTLLYIIASLFLQVNAFAQSTFEDFSYSEKTQAIQLAKVGGANKVTAKKEPVTLQASIIKKGPQVQPLIQATPAPKPQSVKRADTTEQTKANATKRTTPKSKWRYLLYAFYFIIVLLICILIYSLFSGYREINKQLPDGFNRRTYLKLNPDVRSSGMNAAAHYLKHGQYEDRPYK